MTEGLTRFVLSRASAAESGRRTESNWNSCPSRENQDPNSIAFTASNHLQIVGRWQFRERRGRKSLIPERDRRDIVLQRQELRTATRIATPSERLDCHPQLALEANRIDDVPSIHPEALLRIVKPVGPHDLRKSGVRCRE